MSIELQAPGHPAVAGQARTTPRSRRRITVRGVLNGIQPFLYMAPAFLIIFIWTYWPLLGTIELSFYQWNLLPTIPRVPVGLDNYVRVVTLPEMLRAIWNTGIYTIGLIPFSVVIPLLLAILINDIRGPIRGWYRAIIFIPVLMAPVVVAIVWRWILHPTQGIFNEAMTTIIPGFPAINWWQSPDLAIWAIVFITGWKLLGFSVLIFSAGLTNVSRECLEAAAVDGANKWQIARYITLPLLSPTIAFVMLLTLLLSAQWTFPLISALTRGGPLDSTTNVYYLLWEFGFRNFNVGLSSAAAVIFFVVFGLLAYGFLRLIDRYSFYDS